MTDDPKGEGLGGYVISQGDQTFGPYTYDKPWPEIAADIQQKLGGKVVAEESETGTVTLSFRSDPEWQEEMNKPGFFRRAWDRITDALFLSFVWLMVVVFLAVLFFGFLKVLEQEQNEHLKAERTDQLEEKLRQACQLLDDEGFDGDPRPCLDEDGKPIK